MNPGYSKKPQSTQKPGVSRLLKQIRMSASPGAVVGLTLMCIVVLIVSIGTKTNSQTTAIDTTHRPQKIQTEPPVETQPAPEETQTITIYISGAVKTPGVYELPAQSRVIDAVRKAQELTENADANTINLAQPLSDGQHIHIPAKGEKPKPPTGNASTQNIPTNTCVDLKTASLTELTSLKGIGEKTAQRILDYRNEHGIKQPQDLLNIDGIGQKTYRRLETGLCK
ncbi:comEA protein [Gleimia coleocanis DSM 15436]|uniref:ComEA protein n=2 Tax=Gleimia TaxID=2692113 RepID=C0W074_9ACTO|nr:comEA protein [Gleimia coleocanis DSM 15436]